MLHDRLEAIAADVARAEDDADDTALVGNGTKLLVVDVPPMLERSEHPRMTDDGRLLGDPARIEKPTLVDVREIDEDAFVFASLDELEPPWREAVGVAPAAAIRRIGGFIGAEVNDADVANAALREDPDVVERAFECVGSFDSKQCGKSSIGLAAGDLRGSPNEMKRAGLHGHLSLERVDLFVNGPRHSACTIREGEGDEAEELGAHSSFAHAGKIHMAAEGGEGKWWLVGLVEVVANPARPHQRIGVEVDGRVFGMNGASRVRRWAPINGDGHRRVNPTLRMARRALRLRWSSFHVLKGSAGMSSSFAGARVLVVGVGGLGCPAALALARAGVGTLGLVDDDLVDIANLHRQILFDDADLGRSKVTAGSAALARLADVKVETHETRLLPHNAVELVSRYDVVVEGSDNFATKFLAADACFMAKRPIVHAAAVRWHGTALAVGTTGQPCYRCLFEDVPLTNAPNCAEAGVVGPMVGVVGAAQADLALSILAGEDVAGELFTFDGRTLASRRHRVASRASCPLCGTGRLRLVDIDPKRYVEGVCL